MKSADQMATEHLPKLVFTLMGQGQIAGMCGRIAERCSPVFDQSRYRHGPRCRFVNVDYGATTH